MRRTLLDLLHGMAGFDVPRTATELGVPADYRVEAAIAIRLDKDRAFEHGGEVVAAVGGVDGVEHAEMRGDRFGELARSSSSKHDGAAASALVALPKDQLRLSYEA